jgi:two-component system nitrogen regulation response regulator GlnG
MDPEVSFESPIGLIGMLLIIVSGRAMTLKEYTFPEPDLILIGRARSSDIILADPDREVSRFHAVLVKLPGPPEQYLMRDLSSSSGITVGGRVVDQAIFHDTITFEIADYTLTCSTNKTFQPRANHLRLVGKKSDIDSIEGKTVVRSLEGNHFKTELAPDRQEIAEEVLRLLQKGVPIEVLFRDLITPIIRSVTADRGIVAVFRGIRRDAWEEVASAGLEPGEQIEVRDLHFADRLLSGEDIQEDGCLLCPITWNGKIEGFICLDKYWSGGSFSASDVSFLRLLCTLKRPVHPSVADESEEKEELQKVQEWPFCLIGKTRLMQALKHRVREAAATDMNVLITGESGTGKELVAQAIHQASADSNGPFVARNCAAVTETLAEAELFGYAAKSGISGADPQGAQGWFELANNGTLFLDEIQALNPLIQDKLLRVLQEKEVLRVRGTRSSPVQVKVIAATDQNMEEAVAQGKIRAAFYYRFSKKIEVPPLRDRKDDIPLLAHYFLDKYASRMGVPPRSLSRAALKLLTGHDWPGNVRELENCIRDAVSSKKPLILSSDLPQNKMGRGSHPDQEESSGLKVSRQAAAVGPQSIEEREREAILEALDTTRGNISRAVKILGYKSRQTMLNKMDRFGISRNYGDE